MTVLLENCCLCREEGKIQSEYYRNSVLRAYYINVNRNGDSLESLFCCLMYGYDSQELWKRMVGCYFDFRDALEKLGKLNAKYSNIER